MKWFEKTPLTLVDYENLISHAASEGVTELEFGGLKAKLLPKTDVDKKRVEELHNKVNQLSMAMGMVPMGQRKTGS